MEKGEGSYHYTQTVRRVKSLTGGNWIQVVTHPRAGSAVMEACGQDTHMSTREGTDLNPSDTVYPRDKPPPGVRLTWISNNLPLKHINDTR